MRKAVFFDRDGIINDVVMKDGKPFSPREFDEFTLKEGIREILEKTKKSGYLNIVVTNQPDIARGLLQPETLDKINSVIERELNVDQIRVCAHDDSDNCNCRKPKPGMIIEAAREWDIELSQSFIFGDSWKDMGAGKNAGITTIIMDYPYNGEVEADHRIFTLDELLSIIN